MIQELLETEVTERLSRDRSDRRTSNIPSGYRNGFKHRKLDTAEERLSIDVSHVRDILQTHHAELGEAIKKSTAVLRGLDWMTNQCVSTHLSGFF